MKFVSILLTSLMLIPLLSVTPVVIAEDESEDLNTYGLNILMWRNDTFDIDENSKIDAVRVVLLINTTTNTEVDAQVLIKAQQGAKTIEQWINFTVVDIENKSITVDAWVEGAYDISMHFYNPHTGNLLKSIDVGLFHMAPALNLPEVSLELTATNELMTGDECSVTRSFVDEIGNRYGVTGKRDIKGIPFTVYDWDEVLDCSQWPAGAYELTESYSNGLGQTTETWLNFTIKNRPPPVFDFVTIGDLGEIETECLIQIIIEESDTNFEQYGREWKIEHNGEQLESLTSTSSVNCTSWEPGVHKIRVTVTNNENITVTKGYNLVRLPPLEPSSEQEEASVQWPTRSGGQDIGEITDETIITVLILALLAFFCSFAILARSKHEEMMSENSDVIDSSQPEYLDLPTYTDPEGIVWRKHENGQVDWWDNSTQVWIPFEG